MSYSLMICAAMHFYGYEGPEDRECSHPRWYKLDPTIAWIQDHDPNVWEIVDQINKYGYFNLKRLIINPKLKISLKFDLFITSKPPPHL